MRKADSIRAWLTAYLPALKTHPDRLQVWVEGGTVASRRSDNPSFVYRYQLKVGLWEFVGNADHVMVPVLAWIEKEQPDLLRRADSAPFSFECELLDGDASDLLISIDVTENVVVTARADGSGYDIDHPSEPALATSFAGVPAPTPFRVLIANDEDLTPGV